MKKADNLRERKPFAKRDVLVYVTIIAAIAALFCAFVIFPRKSPQTGFNAYHDGVRIFSYVYEDDFLDVEDKWLSRVVKDGDRIFVYFDDAHTDFNELTVNRANGTVTITDSTCSRTKDCVYEPELGDTGAIYCAPHKLKLAPTTAVAQPPVIG